MVAAEDKRTSVEEGRQSTDLRERDSSLRKRLAGLLSAGVFYTLLVLILLVSIPYGTVEPWWEALFETIVFALGALWIVEGFLSGRWLGKEHRIFLPLVVLALYAFLQTLPLLPGDASVQGLKTWNAISADPFETRLSVLKLLALVLAGVLLVRYARGAHRLRALIYTIIFVGVLSALFGILRETTQRSQGFFLPFLKPGAGYGQFINKNHFAYLMEMGLGLTLGLGVARGGAKREHLLIYFALALPLWTALVLSNSRGGILSMLAEIFFLAILFSFFGVGRLKAERVEEMSFLRRLMRAQAVRALLIVGLVVTVFLGAIWTGGEALTSRLETVSSEMAGDGASLGGAGRKDIWKATWRMIKDHPLMGVGINGYWAAIPSYHQASGELTPQQAHNDYLELLASGGLIGCLLVLWFLFLFIKTVRQNFRAKDSFGRACVLAACAGLFAVAVHSAVDFGLHITINALVFTALIAIAVAGGASVEEKRLLVP